MGAPGKRRRATRVNPFVYYVPAASTRKSAAAQAAPEQAVTLRRIAYEEVGVPLEDLRAANAEPLASLPADAPLEPETEVRLPLSLTVRGSPYGHTFSLGSAEQQLQECEAMLDDCAAAWEREYGAHTLAQLPERAVRSPAESVLALVHSEAARQLQLLPEKLRAPTVTSTHMHYAVKADAVREGEKKIEEDFRSAVAELEGHTADDRPVVPSASALMAMASSNDLTPAALQTVRDASDDFCVEHTHRWEFAVHGINTKEPRETWAVLSCQPLVALLDAVECATTRDPLHTSRNAFFFIHDTFYVDDRHSSEPDYVDLSAAIRGNDPLKEPSTFDAAAHQPFHRCPVKSAATTTFKDLGLKMGEYGVLRHCGGCDHYLYLSHVRSLRGQPRTERADFPHRVSKVRDLARRCLLCSVFPATTVLYEDPLSPESPAYYCAACFDILHSADTPAEAARYHRRDATDFGETYFKVL